MACRFVAEVSSNHHQDLARCLQFVETAATLGCWAVKFQKFTVASLFAPEALHAHPHLREREEWELPTDYLAPIAKACRACGIQFACTPFSLEAVEQLERHVEVFKVASYELLWDDLLIAVAQTHKPVILSTGMATLPEVEHAVETLYDAGCIELTLLQCNSGYPTPLFDCNLAAIETLAKHFNEPVGLSDHSRSPAALYRAVHRWGAQMVEFHLDLDGRGDEFSQGHCWLPSEIAPVIGTIQEGCAADGTGEKVPQQSELADREWRADPLDGLRPLMATRATLR